MKKQRQGQLQQPLIDKKKQEKEQIAIKPSSMMALFTFATNFDWFLIILGSVTSLASGVIFPLFMAFFGDITQVFIVDRREQAQKAGFDVAIKFFVLGGASWLLYGTGYYCWNLTGARQILQYKKKYYETILQQEVAWFDSQDTNKLSTQIAGNISAVQGALGQKIGVLQSMTVTSIYGFVYAYFKCWQLSLILTATLPLLVAGGVLMMKALQFMAQKNKISYEHAGSVAQQAIGSIKTVKSLVGEQFESQKFKQNLQKSYAKCIRYLMYSGIAIGFVIFVFLGIYALGFYFGKQLIIDDPLKYDSAGIIATMFCIVIGGSSIGQLSPVMKNIVQARIAAAKLFFLMKREKTLVEPAQGNIIQTITSIQFKDVNFNYPKLNDLDAQITQVLKNISLTFEENKVTALVGESGSGKSTIIQLLMRYFDPSSGQISINNLNLKKLNTQSFREHIGFVGQQPVLFSMSIKENILLANPKLTDEEIKQSLKQANAYEFVMSMEKGLDTYVGTGGAQLSGGQKQRIAIARAISRHPSVLILDEATSALDRKNEKQIQETLKNLSKKNITTIVIAHRLSTIKNADQIVVLGKGSIIEKGDHQTLLNKEGSYYQLVKTQIAAEKQQINDFSDQKQKSNFTEETKVQINEQKKQVQSEQSKIPKQKLDSVFRKLLAYSSESFGLYIFGVLCAILRGAIFPFFNVALGNVLALLPIVVTDPDAAKKINEYCILFVFIAVGGGLTTFGYTFGFGVVGQRLVFKLRNSVFTKLLKLPVSYYDKPENTPGGISTKLAQDAYQIHNLTTGVIGVIVLNISTVTTALAFAFYYSWLLTLIVLGLSPLMVISNYIQMSFVKRMATSSQETEKQLGSIISDTVCNIRTVKSFGHDDQFMRRFKEASQKLAQIQIKKNTPNSIFQGMSRGMIMFVEGLMFYLAAVFFQNNLINDPEAIYIAIFSIVFAAAGVGNNSAYMPDMAKGKIAGVNVFDILETEDEKQKADKQGGVSKQVVQGNIQFIDVSFKYPQRQQYILEGFNLKVKKGEKVGLVGSSGSGKSTIIQLLMRFYDIQKGQILVDGQSIKSYQLYSYRKQLGLVSQQPVLFTGTVKQNICYNKEQLINTIRQSKQSGAKLDDISMKTIKKYTDIAHATGFIQQWEQKFEKQVGQKGSQVSGGQKQRIALSRALIRKPHVMLLDQSTSALDADSQKTVFENLKGTLKKITSISIAHRLSTIEDANRIIMMRNGKIIEEGTYQQLMNLKQNFYRLARGIS